MSIHDIPDAELRRGDVACTILCQMDFATNPQRWWLGYGDLTTGGVTYRGTGDVIQISSMSLTYGTSAGMITFTIPAASPEMIARCDNQATEVNNRSCRLFYQLFSMQEAGEGGGHRGRLIGSPISVFTGRMRDMRSTSSHVERTIELEAYGRMSWQGKPPHGRWTPADQKARFPGDKGLDLTPSLKDRSVVWVPAG
ncbi:hypothetical protein pthi1_p41 [Paracoccus phage vB_PthS_Pthi1]|uniref:Uncharacterized protein n=1 Tax=Paracoccus thiocyanatus TaxID=34006 RepID=A0A1N6SEI7_9RHOB|nr:hypothetical protein [Paracoccus thiocyanatus]AZV00406.1 hypothetical protein pthi1_p41 [Paracoccus phage vB_PthS_Pthi1]SIQ39504.1 hypothetical protein SAMN05421641_10783 [Paracoccus thiocyanatus]